ncbi:hypothetical protein LDENG_00286200 [Lucifuga dentata]|nr:hypothetical protein LDENG_00286200 [Lucifuga dentata]
MKWRRTGPPDGGYGWIVVTSAFLVMGLTAAVLKNFGFFFLDIQSHFGVLTSTTSWVNSTTIAMLHIRAPVASVLASRFSHRAVIVLGGLLAALGMVLASLDLDLPWLYVGMGLLQAPSSSGSLIPTPGGGALLIIGGLQLNLCVCGALMRPLEETKDISDASTVVVPPKKKPVFHCTFTTKPELLLYILFVVFAAAGFFIPPLFLVPFANSLGMDKYWPASILSVLAMADLVGRLSCGWLANMRLMRNLQLLTMMVTMLGVVLLLLPVSHNYLAMLVFCSLYGLLFGGVVAIHVITIVDIIGLEGFDSGLGLFMLFRSIGGFVGPPAAGWLVDHMDDYSAAFYLSGLCLVSSAAFVILVDCLVERRKATEEPSDPEVHQSINQQEEGEGGNVK